MSRAKSDFVDWASCLHPFGEDPYGPALPHDPVCAAIREARREDDPGLPQGVWERELKRADWDKALSLSLGVLRERSKDMQVAGWACEAALMRYGFASLPGGLRMIAGLCSGFGDGLHPQPEGSDQEARLARLAWLDSTLAERAASLPITEASPDVPAATYADWMAMEHRERIQNGNGKNGVAGDARRMLNLAGTQTSPAFHASLHGQLREALLALDDLARAADALCGGGACIDSGLNSADIATDHDGHEAGADLLLADQMNISCLDHGIGCFDSADQAAGLNHTKSEFHRLFPP